MSESDQAGAQSADQRIARLEAGLDALSENLTVVGQAAVDRMNETEGAVARLLAMEAILVQMMKANPVDMDAVKQAIRDKTAEISGNPEGSPLVIAAADEIVRQVKG